MNNTKDFNKLYTKEKTNDFLGKRNKKILSSIFSINNDSQTFYDVSDIVIDYEDSYKNPRRGFDFECDNGRMFLKNDDNELPKVGFLNLDEKYVNNEIVYSYKMMNVQEFSSFLLIKHLATYDEVFKVYCNSLSNKDFIKINKNLDDFTDVLKDTLEKIKEELTYYKQSNILEIIKKSSKPYSEEEIYKELPFLKKEKDLLLKKNNKKQLNIKENQSLGLIMLCHLDLEKENYNKMIDDYFKIVKEKNEKSINQLKIVENKINYIKNNYNKRIDLVKNFVEKNVENKIENKMEGKTSFDPTVTL